MKGKVRSVKNWKKICKDITSKIVVGISVLFIVRFFWNLEIDFRILINRKIFLCIMLGIVFSVISLLASALAWKRTIEFFAEREISYQSAVKVYLQANLGKYIPGNIAHFVERNLFAVKAGMGHAETVMATVLEIVGLLTAAFLLGIMLSFENICRMLRLLGSIEYAMGLLVLFIAGVAVVCLLYKKFSKIRYLGKKMKQKLFWRMFGLNVLLYIFAMILLADLMCVLVWILKDQMLTGQEVWMVMDIYVLAWTAGFAVPGAPGGIGVREFVITLLTRNHILQEYILLAMIIHRIITVLGDAFGYLWAKIM